MPQFQPKLSKHKSFKFVVFPAVCAQFLKILWQRKLKTVKHEQTSYAIRDFEETVAVFYFKNTSKFTLTCRK